MRQDLPEITVRTATANDVDDIAAVFDAAFATLRSIYRPTEVVEARQLERGREGVRLVAELDGRAVGTVQYDCHKEHVHVIGLAVDPDFQRLGVARHLMDWILANAQSLGHQVVVLETIKEAGIVPFFEELGFKVLGESATGCFVSDRYPELHEVKMERRVAGLKIHS